MSIARAHPSRRTTRGPRDHAPAPWRVAVLPSENDDRHKPGVSFERPPRPLGMASGVPWEPYEPERSYAKQQFTVRFLEWLEGYPWLQGAAAGALSVVSGLLGHNDAPQPPDVPDEPGSWKFAAVGDYGSGSAHQAKVAANMLRGGNQLVVTTGDNVYPTGRWSDYAKNWDPKHLYGELARRIPFMPSLGNHDMYRDDLRPYFGHFPHLKGLPYYTYTMRNAQFFALDSDQDLRPGSAQLRWLEEELRSSRSKWKIVYMHYPMYGRNPKDFDDIRTAVQPLLARHGVQLALVGHEHNYQRAVPVDGVLHVLTGGGGQQVYPFLDKQPAHIARRGGIYHHVEVSVGATKMVLRAIDEDGKVFDTAEIPATATTQAARGAAALARPSRPGTATTAAPVSVSPRRRRQAHAAHR